MGATRSRRGRVLCPRPWGSDQGVDGEDSPGEIPTTGCEEGEGDGGEGGGVGHFVTLWVTGTYKV